MASQWLNRTRSNFKYRHAAPVNFWTGKESVHSVYLLLCVVFNPAEVSSEVDIRPHWLATLATGWYFLCLALDVIDLDLDRLFVAIMLYELA